MIYSSPYVSVSRIVNYIVFLLNGVLPSYMLSILFGPSTLFCRNAENLASSPLVCLIVDTARSSRLFYLSAEKRILPVSLKLFRLFKRLIALDTLFFETIDSLLESSEDTFASFSLSFLLFRNYYSYHLFFASYKAFCLSLGSLNAFR